MAETTPDLYAAKAWDWRGRNATLSGGYARIANARPRDPEAAARAEIDLLMRVRATTPED